MEWFRSIVTQTETPGWMAIGALLTAFIALVMVKPAMTVCGGQPGRWPVTMAIVGAILGVGLAYAMHAMHCQEVPEVRPSTFTQNLRIPFHLVCLGFLLVITATDLATLYIPDYVVFTGLAIAVTAACLVGDLQMEHVWVDWNAEIPQIRGPSTPAWLETYPHLHGLAWSLSGAVVGAGLTWLVKEVAQRVLGKPSMGAGDVTLMAMIGAFLGWQPTVVAFFLAPLLALVLGPLARRVSKHNAVPYGPFLAAGAVVVLFTWKWIWMFEFDISMNSNPAIDDRMTRFAVRRLFGDWVLLVSLLGVALGGTALLMGLLRWFRSVEVKP